MITVRADEAHAVHSLSSTPPGASAARPRSWRRVALGVALGVVCAVGTAGCGAVWASQAVSEAQAALDQARVLKAHRLAPYDYWLAASYVDKAKRTEGYSEYEGATRFANEAKALAQKAIDEAAQAERRQDLLQQRLQLRDAAPAPGAAK
jgi:hypothetical protein